MYKRFFQYFIIPIYIEISLYRYKIIMIFFDNFCIADIIFYNVAFVTKAPAVHLLIIHLQYFYCCLYFYCIYSFILFSMTTITIDTPLKLKTTHFADPMQAAYALMWIQIQHMQQHDDWDEETSDNILAYEHSLAQENEIFSLSQAKNIVLWNVK